MLAPHTFLEKREDQFTDTPSSTRPTHQQIRYPLVDPQEIFREAREYFHLFHHEHGTSQLYQEHLNEIQAEIERTGTYWQTLDELVYGARVAWRNSTRCIGRLHWKSLTVRDLRHLSTAESPYRSCLGQHHNVSPRIWPTRIAAPIGNRTMYVILTRKVDQLIIYKLYCNNHQIQ